MSQFNDGMFSDSNLKIRNVTQAQFNAQKVNFNPDVIYRVDGVLHLPDETTESYASAVTATRDASGNVVGLGVGGETIASLATLKTLRQSIHMNQSPLAVMASPPTVVTNTTNSQSAGQLFAATNSDANATGINSRAFSLFRCGNLRKYAVTTPGWSYLTADTIYQTTAPLYANQTMQVSFIHTGAKCTIWWRGSGSQMLIKVDGEFTSLTPQDASPGGSAYFTSIDFGSVGTRRIDLIGRTFHFGGVFTDITHSIVAAPKRGPRMVVLGDSFTEGGGNEVSLTLSWVTYLAELLGWDDVVASGVASTGLLAATAPKMPYKERAAHDVAGLNPDICWVSLSLNDSAFTGAQVLDAAKLLVATIQTAGSHPLFVFSSPTYKGGIGFTDQDLINQNNLVRSWCAEAGHLYVDDMSSLLAVDADPHATTITADAAAAATSIATTEALIPGSTYAFADGTTFFVRSVSGLTATIDYLRTAQTSGATLTQTGSAYLTGNGRVGATVGWGSSDILVSSDTIHPSNAGHLVKAQMCARLFINAVAEHP